MHVTLTSLNMDEQEETFSKIILLRYVSRLGLDCLVRESLQAGDPNSLAGLVGAFGGESLHHGCSNEYKSGLAGAVMMDVTHDNVSCIEKRSLPDCLSTASVIGKLL